MKTFARGVNFMGQLGIRNKFQNELDGKKVKQLDSHFTQSYILLDDGQLLHCGHVLDSLSTTRVLNWYKKSPKLARMWQKYSPLGATLSFRSGIDSPSLLNSELIFQAKIDKISAGGSFVLALTENKKIFGMGENYKGQLGLGDAKYKFKFEEIQFQQNEAFIDIAAGYQHSYFLTNSGTLYGSGRSNFYQVVQQTSKNQKDYIYADFLTKGQFLAIEGNRFCNQVSAGFHHTVFRTEDNELYAMGLNNHGQCGTSNLSNNRLQEPNQIFMDLQDDEKIIDIWVIYDFIEIIYLKFIINLSKQFHMSAGKSHNVFITQKGNIYMFGATLHNQALNQRQFQIDACSPIPISIDFEDKDEKPVKVKCKFDRTAIFTNTGNCYIYGGENLQNIGGENHSVICNVKHELGIQDCIVKDVALGYAHTLIYVEKQV